MIMTSSHKSSKRCGDIAHFGRSLVSQFFFSAFLCCFGKARQKKAIRLFLFRAGTGQGRDSQGTGGRFHGNECILCMYVCISQCTVSFPPPLVALQLCLVCVFLVERWRWRWMRVCWRVDVLSDTCFFLFFFLFHACLWRRGLSMSLAFV